MMTQNTSQIKAWAYTKDTLKIYKYKEKGKVNNHNNNFRLLYRAISSRSQRFHITETFHITQCNLVAAFNQCLLRHLNTQDYTPIAFDERVTFWLQRAGSLPCACLFAALYACAIA